MHNIKSLIVGIDPGISTGIAILDMHESLLHLSSRRNIGKSEVVRSIAKFGKPIIIAVDVVPAPKNVERIASSMGAVMFVSEKLKSMSIKEKNDIVKRFKRKYKKKYGIELKIEGKHERDALAAAVKAWKRNSYLLRKVDNALQKSGLENIFDEVVEVLIKGRSENISNAINKVLSKSSFGERKR